MSFCSLREIIHCDRTISVSPIWLRLPLVTTIQFQFCYVYVILACNRYNGDSIFISWWIWWVNVIANSCEEKIKFWYCLDASNKSLFFHLPCLLDSDYWLLSFLFELYDLVAPKEPSVTNTTSIEYQSSICKCAIFFQQCYTIHVISSYYCFMFKLICEFNLPILIGPYNLILWTICHKNFHQGIRKNRKNLTKITLLF